MTSRLIWLFPAVAFAASLAHGNTTVLDDFESGEGRFTNPPSFSGSTQGETETAVGAGPSTALRSTDFSLSGVASKRVFLDDAPGVNASDGTAWRLRLLSGGGAIANNAPIPVFPDGYVGYFVLTTTPNLRASILIDDGTTTHLERAVSRPIIADGLWHLYQWRLQDADQWDGFAGTGVNGLIDSTTVTIDAVYVDAVVDPAIADQDAVFYFDNVSYSDNGPIPVPEPSSLAFLACGVAALGWRRRPRPGFYRVGK